MMIKKILFISIIFTVILFNFGCQKTEKDKIETKSNIESIKNLAYSVCEEVGQVTQVFDGDVGTPIIVLEENHASIAGQIQHAITLVRLHEKYGLKDIALEGYLKEHKKINTEWYNQAAKGNQAAKLQVAVRLIKEGEISCAEFIKLAYNDVELHPIEKMNQYTVELDEEASKAPMVYLIKIAQLSLRQDHVPKVQQLQSEIEELEDDQKPKKIEELLDYILSIDPWIKAKDDFLRNQDSLRVISAEQMLAVVNEIKNRAENLSVPLESSEKEAMARNIIFWQKRSEASATMLQATTKVADQKQASLIAMIIGAAHTEQMCALLKDFNRTFGVITPLSSVKSRGIGDLSWEMLNRKYQRSSVYSEGFTKTLLEAFSSEKLKKPEPVLSEPWLEAKSELYLFTDRITREILGPPPTSGEPPFEPPKPPGGAEPPYGYSDNEFKGKRVYIDPHRITIIPDTDERKRYTVLFPVILNPDDERKRTEIWVKAISEFSPVPSEERENAEALLKRALEEIQAEQIVSDEEKGKKIEDEGGRVQITLNTKAIITSNRYDAVTRSVAEKV